MHARFASLAAILALASGASAGVNSIALGTEKPPLVVGGFYMTPFPGDGIDSYTDIATLKSPEGGSIAFGPSVSARKIGDGWATWSHGYTGDVYYSDGAKKVTLTLPSGTGAFYLYAEPNSFSAQSITVTASDGAKTNAVVQSVEGDSGAKGYAFYATCESTLTTVEIACADDDFAVGEFGISVKSGVGATTFGTDSPPYAVYGSWMFTFGDDGIASYTDITKLATPLGGQVGFSPAVNTRRIGDGWATWSHGYTGDVYYSNGATKVTMTMPANTGGFYFYAEPEPFAVYTITAKASDGTTTRTVSQDADGQGGATGWAFFAKGHSTLTSIEVSSSTDFAIGELAISAKRGLGGEKLGTSAAPSTLGGWKTTAYDTVDARPLHTDYSTFPSPISSLGFTSSVPLNHRVIGDGWGTWSHGYTGSVYYTNGQKKVVLTMPDRTTAFSLYAEPNPFSVFTMTARTSDGLSSAEVSDDVDGNGGAKGFGFYAQAGTEIEAIEITSDTDFAIGEFAIAAGCFCSTDCNQDGKLNVNDFICFQSQWQQKTPYGDFNNDGKYNVNDFIAFQSAFAKKTGCP